MGGRYAEGVSNRTRAYRSPLREEQAQRTRTAVVDAAERCFLEHGYAATTMKDIAAAAGVSVQTVFAQGTKASLLLHCVDRSVRGDDEDVPLLAREDFVRLLGEGSRDVKLDALRSIVLRSSRRAAPMALVFRAAAGADPEIAEAYVEYGQRRYQDVQAVVGAFAPWLRPELGLDRAADVMWAMFSHEADDALLRDRGWSAEAHADWLVDAFERLLLTDRT